VKFVRSELEAYALAVRLAQRASGKSGVAMCGLVGSSSLISIRNLLEPKISMGELPNSVSSNFGFFEYNNFARMREVLSRSELGVIFMESIEINNSNKEFVEEVRALTEKSGIVLIFDEIDTGFREVFGGLHKKLEVFPDVSVLGRALGNGYPISAIVGRRNVMNQSEFSLPSGVSWSDRIGFAAALAAMDEMENIGASDVVTHLGRYYKSVMSEVLQEAEIEYEFSELSSIVHINIRHSEVDVLQCFLSQEMLSRYQVLFTNKFYPSICHNHEDINILGEQLSQVLRIAKPLLDGHTLRQHILGTFR
jgi:glutamate-1-semialdehyde aminotransferase